MLLRRPDLPAGVISLSGVPPVLGRQDLAPATSLRGLPVFAAHGTEDALLPIELGRSLRSELQRLGLEVEWHEYPMGHMVVPEEIEDAAKWFARRL